MKAKRTKPGQIVNPEFSHAAKREAIREGVPYLEPEFLELPIGEVVDDPNCWMLCPGVTNSPCMVPADDECAQRVLAFLSAPKRKEFLQKLARLSQPDVLRQMSPQQRQSHEFLSELYANEIAALQTAP